MRAKKKGYAAGGKLQQEASKRKQQQTKTKEMQQQIQEPSRMQGGTPMKMGGKLKKYAGGGKMKGMDSPGEGVSKSDADLLRHGNADFTTSLERMSKGSGSKKNVPLPPRRKKPVAKKSLGGVLGSLSPVAGAITGKGLFGDAAKAIGKGVKNIKKSDVAPLLGVGAGLALNELSGKKKKAAPKTSGSSVGKATAMKKGGSPMHRMPDGTMMKGKVHKMKHGGSMCRGMGAATRGGNFKIG